MQSQRSKVIIIFTISVLFGGTALVWWLMTPTTQTKTVQTGQQTAQYNNSSDTLVTPIPQTQQKTVVDIEVAYVALFQKILAQRITFVAINASTTGDSKSLYALYSKDVTDAKKFSPGEDDYSIHVALVDLTDDGTAEALVLEDLSGFCGTGGCALDIYTKKSGKWTKIYSTVAQGNIGLSNTLTNGYRDLFLTVFGIVGSESRVVRYTWDGTRYNPGEVMATWDGSTFITP